MKKFINIWVLAFSLFSLSILPSKAFIMDVWTIEGANPAELAKVVVEYREKAAAVGAKYTQFRMGQKVRGDGSNITFVYGYYDSYEDQMFTQQLLTENPEPLQSTYGAMSDEDSGIIISSATMANNSSLGDDPAAGNSFAYAFMEIKDGINFALNFPKLQERLAEQGMPAIIDVLYCATCGADVLPANAVGYISAANLTDLGKALDIYALEENQLWLFRNMNPHIEMIDQGISVMLTD